MARPKKLKPDYCHDKPSGRAYVRLDGKKKSYLGDYGTQASRDEYDRVLGEWIAAGRTAAPSTAGGDGITVSTLIAGFWTHAQSYYRKPDGTPTSEVDNMRQALRPLRKLYGETTAAKFGPLSLKALQQHMIKLGWARTFINRQVNRIRMCFKWDRQRAHSLVGLRGAPNRPRARRRPQRREGVGAGEAGWPRSTRPRPSRSSRRRFRRWSSCRRRRGCDRARRASCAAAMKDKTWTYRLATSPRARARAREFVAKFLKPDLSQYLFSPAAAEQARRRFDGISLSPGFGARPGLPPSAEDSAREQLASANFDLIDPAPLPPPPPRRRSRLELGLGLGLGLGL